MADNLFRVQRGLSLAPQSSAPASPVNGDVYYDATLNSFVVYNNGQWANLASQTDVASATTLTSTQFTAAVVQNSMVRITGSTVSAFHGMTASSSSKEVLIYNETSVNVSIFNNSATEPTAANRFLTQGSVIVILPPGSCTVMAYDSGQSRWIVTEGVTSLTTQVNGVLPIANGGTNNGSLAVTAGGVIYTDGTRLQNVGAGTTGQVLQSNGASPPTWANSASSGLTLVEFTTPGATTWTVPIGVTTVLLLGQGGGGGGGGGGASSGGGTGNTGGGGGGGGGTPLTTLTWSVTPGATINLTVGAGGTGGVAGSGAGGGGGAGGVGNNGGASTFDTVSFGGAGHGTGGGANGQAGGATSTFTGVTVGGNGGTGGSSFTAGGTGGSNALFSGGAGGAAAGISGGFGGSGGGGGGGASGKGPGGTGGAARSNTQPALPGNVPTASAYGAGGGGGGGCSNGGTAIAGHGGAGNGGYIAVIY